MPLDAKARETPDQPVNAPVSGDDAQSAGEDAIHVINQRIFETSLDLILVTDRHGRLLRVSPSSLTVLGYRPEEMIGRIAKDFLYPDDLETTREHMRAARRTGLARGFECRYVCKDGRVVLLWWTGVWSAPEQQHFFIGRDVTDVRNAGQAVLRANRELNALIAASPLAIFMLDREGIVRLWNASAERIFGFTAAEAIGNLPPYLTEDHVVDFRARLRQTLADPAPIGDLQTQRRRKDGKLIDVSVSWGRVHDEDGQILGVMYMVADVTEHRRLEDRLRQAQKMEAIGNLTGGLAHDFNNLLGIIILNLDTLRELPPDDPDAGQLTQDSLDAAVRGAELTRHLLAFARRQPLQPERTDVNRLVESTAKLLRRTIGEQVEVTVQCSADVWPAVVDPAQLESSLINLANNARDAMPKGGRLIIATGNRVLDADYAARQSEVRPGDYTMVEVSDTGAGMSAETLGHVFEPFFTTKEAGKGTGLGLSMVFGFIKQSGGHINIYSEVGIGTSVRLYLPRADAGKAAAKERHATAVARGGGETVLAVEDNPGLRRVVVRQLTELGYRVLVAGDSEQAFGMLESQPIDLLFTDIVLPGGTTGYELAAAALSRWPHLKIVLTSGFSETTIGTGAPGNSRLLIKPYRRDDLARAIRDALRDASHHPSA